MKKFNFTLGFIILILITFCNGNLFSQWNSNWKWTMSNPWGDDNRYLQMISENEYIGFGFNAGMIKTTDGGNTWTTRSDVSGYTTYDRPNIRNGWFINNNFGFAVGDQSSSNGLISRTTNGGLNWTNTFIPSTTINDIYFLNSNTGFIVGNVGVGYKTTNGGVNWTAMTMGLINNLNGVFALDANNIYAVGQSGKFFKSTDGGSSWSNSSTASAFTLYTVNFINSSTGFIGGSSGVFQITTDGGASWVSRPTPVTQNLIKKLKITGSEILAVGDEKNLFRTTDNGITWNSLNFSSSAPAENVTGAMYSIDKINNTIVISGVYGLIYKSTDNGNTWACLTVAMHKDYLQGIYASSMNGKIWAVGGPGPNSVLYSSNGGADWSSTFGGARHGNYRDIEFLNDNTGYICGESGTILRTTNSGNSWDSIPPMSNQAANCISIPDNNTVLVGCNAGLLLRSTNSGVNFSLINVGLNTQQINDLSFINANTGWGAMSSRIIKTTDKGATWTTQLTHTTTLLSINMIDANTGYACGYAGSFFKTTNGGINWIQKPSQIPTNLTKIDFADANNGFAVSGGGIGFPGSAMKTTNGGTTWQIINAGSNPLFGLKVFTPDSAITVGYANILKYMAPPNYHNLTLTLNFESCPVNDTVTVELRSNISPYNVIESKNLFCGQGVPAVTGFTAVSNGTPYFISVKHRNSINTWSSNAVSFTANALNYNFTSANSQSYGSNMRNVGGLWSFYQGDVNQDEIIDATDVSSIENDVAITKTGPYINTDLNFDEIVDASDLSVVDNNSGVLIQALKP